MRTQAGWIAVFALAVTALQFSVRAADSNRSSDEEAIKKIEHDWINAIAKRDGAYMQKIEADDYIFTGPDGKALTKAEDIKSNTTGDVVFDDFKIDSVKVRFYGDTAIVNGVGTVKAHQQEEDLSGQYSWTDVFVKQKGEWKAVSAHVTAVASGSPED